MLVSLFTELRKLRVEVLPLRGVERTNLVSAIDALEKQARSVARDWRAMSVGH